MAKKILVVDDSKTALMMEREILEKRTNYQCVTASDGQEAVEKAQQERPDLVLMDVVMPRMNGFEACKMMRQQAEHARDPHRSGHHSRRRSPTWRQGSRVDATTTLPSRWMAPNWWRWCRATWASKPACERYGLVEWSTARVL